MTATTSPSSSISGPVSSARRLTGTARTVARLAGPWILIVIIWEASAAASTSAGFVAPSEVAATTLELGRTGVLTTYAKYSLLRLLAGVGIAILVGVPLGLLFGSNRYIAAGGDRFVQFLLGVSGIAWLPLAIIWTGFSETTIIMVVAYTAILPIVVNTAQGLRAVPVDLEMAVRCLGGGGWRVARDVHFFGAIASIVAGIKAGFGYGWRAVIGTEMVVGLGGLGYMIFDARQYAGTDVMISGMLCVGILYLVIDRLVLESFAYLVVGRWSER